MDDQGIYRVVGVNSKVNKLLNLGLSKYKKKKKKTALAVNQGYLKRVRILRNQWT